MNMFQSLLTTIRHFDHHYKWHNGTNNNNSCKTPGLQALVLVDEVVTRHGQTSMDVQEAKIGLVSDMHWNTSDGV